MQICEFFNSRTIVLLYIIKYLDVAFFFIFIEMLTMNRLIILLILFWSTFEIKAQNAFQMDSDKDKVSIPFKLINNLIFIPIKVNGIELNFLLDTGVEETILLSLEEQTEVRFFNVAKVKFKGLGSNDAIEGLKSSGNILDLDGFTDKNHELYIVLDGNFNFSAHIGIPVNGIIGYHFFKNHLVEINYDKKKIVVYRNSDKIAKKINRKYAEIPMTIEKNKPYIVADVALNEQEISTKLLVDIGNSDALWLFENEQKGIAVPPKNFTDYLGKGFSGEIHGKRSRIATIKFGDYEFKKPIVAFPDSTSIKSVTMVKDRAGSIGGEMTRRFTVIFDYPEKKIYLRKSNYYNQTFHYNMSGIELQNEGLQWVQETVTLQTQNINAGNTFDGNGNKNDFKYKFSLKPVYIISNIRENSAAAICGLQKGDTISKINGTVAYHFSLSEINELLKSEEGKWINLLIVRNGIEMKFKFQLKSFL